MSRESGVSTVYNPKTPVIVGGVLLVLFVVTIFFVASAYLSNPRQPNLGAIKLPPLSKYDHVEIPTPKLSTPTPFITAYPTLPQKKLDELMVELNKLDAPKEVLDEIKRVNELREQ